ncbi:MAG: hypothetical protein FWD38_11935 [Oscillospiraceae bacterium]|nr:hypothetical protein [Oscillospiraceae bacterium]
MSLKDTGKKIATGVAIVGAAASLANKDIQKVEVNNYAKSTAIHAKEERKRENEASISSGAKIGGK